MYHAHFRGTHYEAGFRWGSLLLKHKNIILEHIPFEITGERMAYGAACVPVYERHYPEILEEIQGLADGQQCDVRILQAVLFSMYAMPPVCNCSCFAAATEEEILFGRNSDFLTELEKLNLNVIYRLTDGAYSFTGNTTAFVEMEDGVNEHGLAVGLTSVYPIGRKPGLNAGMLLRYFLEKCKTVAEVVSCIGELPVASAQTFTLADAAGDIAVIECNSERTEIAGRMPETGDAEKGKEVKRNAAKRFVCATNIFHLPDMVRYNRPAMACSDRTKEEGSHRPEIGAYRCSELVYADRTEEEGSSRPEIGDRRSSKPERHNCQEAQRHGHGEPDDWFAERRYQTLVKALSRKENDITLPAKELLSGKHGFLCQYDRNTGKDTVWSVVYDLKRHRIYRSEGNPGRCRCKEDGRFPF